MSSQSYNTSMVEAFNYHKDCQETIGHITSLKIGSKAFKEDISVQDPTAIEAGTKVKVGGVVSNIYWEGGFAQPVAFDCQVGDDNAKDAAILTHQDLSDTTVEFKFNVYKYDPQDKKYYKCFHTQDIALKGLIQKSGGDLEFAMDVTEANGQVPSPINFPMYLSVMPQEQEQEIHFAVGVAHKMVKKWGVTVA
jgi:3D (Asp-Asp-Asp) domain-containing protein